MEALYLLAVAQTVLFNPVLLQIGGLSVYTCAVTWVVVAGASLGNWMWTRDDVLLAANRRLAVVVWVSITAIALQILITGFQVYTIDSLVRLLYAPLGIFAAFSVYRRIEQLLDITVGLVGLGCVLLMLPRIGTPVDLSNRLNPASLGGRNDFGAFLMIVIVLRVSIWAYRRHPPPWYVLGGLAASLVALVLTLARSPMLALVVGLLAVWVSSLRRRGITGKSLRATLMLAVFLSPFVSQPGVRSRVSSISVANASGRRDIWQAALDRFGERPLIGHGFGSFNETSPHIIEDFVTSGAQGQVSAVGGQPTSSAHNVILQILAEGGVTGLAIVVWSVYYLLRACWHPVLVPVLVAIFVDSLFDTFAYVVQVSWVLGLVFATGLMFRSEQEVESSDALGSMRATHQRA